MSEIQLIEQALQRTARRRRWLQAWRGLGQGLFWGALLWLTALVVYKLFPVSPMVPVAAGALAGVLVLIGFLHGLCQGASLLATARWVDEKRSLRERLSTALEYRDEALPGEWQRLVMQDAAGHARDIDPRTLLPFTVPRILRWGMLVLVLGIGLGWVPEYRSAAYLQKQEDAAHVQEVGRKLAALTRQNLEKRQPALAPTQQSMEDIAALGDDLGKVKLSRTEALAKLTSAAEKVRDQSKDLAENPVLKSLEKTARQSSGRPNASTPSGAQAEAMKQALGKTGQDPSQLDSLQKKLQDLQQKAAGMPAGSTEGAQEAQREMAQALAQLAQEAQALGLSMPDLEQALESLQNQQIDQFLRDMQMAHADLEKLKNMARTLQQMQMQSSQTGKNLAEQLEFGQPEAAQQTLQSMISKLQSGQTSPEDMQRMMEEVVKAVDPAGPYGETAKHLEKAAKQLQEGDKAGAAESLAQAKQELESLMQQMADAQALQEALEALERAQMAIASGKSWEQCKGGYCAKCGGAGCGVCDGSRLTWGQGGKPGYGVGTWADESGWTTAAQQQPVDHSGIDRPDMAGREHVDRPEDLNDALNPTRIKGNMSPGRSMPSIRLRDVHIKGNSTVEYEAAMTAAQEDAQSAVNQDKVPRPYLNAVRDYFDDIKD